MLTRWESAENDRGTSPPTSSIFSSSEEEAIEDLVDHNGKLNIDELSSLSSSESVQSYPAGNCLVNPAGTDSSMDVARSPKEESAKKSSRNEQWKSRYDELVRHKKRFGSFIVTSGNQESEVLARWVKRQRHQYHLKQKGHHSNLTDERQRKLDDLGFVWGSRKANWEESYALLVQFTKQHPLCHIPKRQAQLSRWAKRQRKQYKLWVEGKVSGLTHDQVKRLEALGFPHGGSSKRLREPDKVSVQNCSSLC